MSNLCSWVVGGGHMGAYTSSCSNTDVDVEVYDPPKARLPAEAIRILPLLPHPPIVTKWRLSLSWRMEYQYSWAPLQQPEKMRLGWQSIELLCGSHRTIQSYMARLDGGCQPSSSSRTDGAILKPFN